MYVGVAGGAGNTGEEELVQQLTFLVLARAAAVAYRPQMLRRRVVTLAQR